MTVDIEYTRPWMYPKQERAIFNDARYAVVEAPQPLDAMVYTPTGPVRMGDISVGDTVLGANGKPYGVTRVLDVGDRDVYELVFRDGARAQAAKSHVWRVSNDRFIGRHCTTAQMAELTPGTLSAYYIDCCEPLQFNPQDVPIDPWLLGILLGDGCLCSNVISISTADPFIVDEVVARVPSGYEVKGDAASRHRYIIKAIDRHAGRCDPENVYLEGGTYEPCTGTEYPRGYQDRPEVVAVKKETRLERYRDTYITTHGNLMRGLEALGLRGRNHTNKFIPDLYKYNTVDCRRRVLCGLIDSDGHVPANSAIVRVVVTSRQLAQDIQEVVRGLGGTCNISHRKARNPNRSDSWDCSIEHRDLHRFVSLPRKARNVSNGGRRVCRKISEINHVGVKPTICLSVDSPDHLYVTDGCIPTHNSTKSGKAQPLYSMVQTPYGARSMCSMDTGDVVLTPGGRAVVTGIYPQGTREIYNVEFSDGSTTHATADHLWEMHTRAESTILMTTSDLATLIREDVELWLPPIVHMPELDGRQLVGVQPAGDAETQCIKISDPRGLYLTDDYIPTHNTLGCLIWLFEQAIQGDKGHNYWWVSHTQSQADDAFRRMKNMIPKDFYKKNEAYRYIELKLNGAYIWFKTGEAPDTLFGADVYAAVIDEASRVREESWHAVRTTLTATRGKIRIIGNVKGRQNWAYHLARKAEESDSDRFHYEKITAYDAADAGVISYDEIEDAKEIYPEDKFRELYLAEPGDDVGNPFGIQHIRRCLRRDEDGNPVAKVRDTEPLVWGIDLAKEANWTVCIALDDECRVCDFMRFKHDSWENTIAKIVARVKMTPALVDSTTTGGDQALERLREGDRHNFKGFNFSGPSKQDLMLGLAIAIQNREIEIPAGIIQNELEQFQYERKPSGNIVYSAPRGRTDDAVDALGLAYRHWQKYTEQPDDFEPIGISRASPWDPGGLYRPATGWEI